MRDSDILKSKKSIRKFINKMVERSLLSQIENDGNILYTFKADGEYENVSIYYNGFLYSFFS